MGKIEEKIKSLPWKIIGYGIIAVIAAGLLLEVIQLAAEHGITQVSTND